MKRILCVASIGGHWIQMLRISKPLEQKYDVVYMSTHPKCATMIEGHEFHVMRDFSRWDAWKLIPEFFHQIHVLRSVRPEAVITTGAAPGLVSLLVAKLCGIKTIWIDSEANVEHPSASGRIASKFATHVYTQWPDLANEKFHYAGNIFGDKKDTEDNLQNLSTEKSSTTRKVFCTVGTQAPFDRFLKIIDELAPDIKGDITVQSFRDQYEPTHVKTVNFLAPDEFNRLFAEADIIIAHAGMGTIISAMQQGKPIIVFPRIAALGEHRNEHQLATAKKMAEMGYVYVAHDEQELRNLVLQENLKSLHHLGPYASQSLIDELVRVIG